MLLAIPLVSVFYVLVHELFERRRANAAATAVTSPGASPTK
jgi:predicted PurR-regulated permease PerM